MSNQKCAECGGNERYVICGNCHSVLHFNQMDDGCNSRHHESCRVNHGAVIAVAKKLNVWLESCRVLSLDPDNPANKIAIEELVAFLFEMRAALGIEPEIKEKEQ